MITIVNAPDITALLSKDDTFKIIFKMYGLPPNWSRPIGFKTLVQIILEQQVSLQSAKAHFEKLDNYLQGLNSKNVLRLTPEAFRNCQISKQKSTYLKALAMAVENGLDFKELLKCSDAEVRKQLLPIKGIGNWTIDVYLMQCHQSKNIIPLGDITIKKTIKELYDINDEDAIKNHVKQWFPYCSLATYFLWHYYLKKRNRTY